jgi:hypothetical protein
MQMVRASLATAKTAHHVHQPEITLEGDTAHVIWAMQDRVEWHDRPRSITGYGHYTERYIRTRDGWRIAFTQLTRLHVDKTAPVPVIARSTPGMKMIVLFRRKQDLTPAQFREYYETRHAPMAMKLFPYLRDYRRNYIRHDLVHKRAAPEGTAGQLDFDVITEIVFSSESDYQRMVRDMTDPAVREQVVEDEKKFLDRTATVVFLVDEAGAPLAPATPA